MYNECIMNECIFIYEQFSYAKVQTTNEQTYGRAHLRMRTICNPPQVKDAILLSRRSSVHENIGEEKMPRKSNKSWGGRNGRGNASSEEKHYFGKVSIFCFFLSIFVPRLSCNFCAADRSRTRSAPSMNSAIRFIDTPIFPV